MEKERPPCKRCVEYGSAFCDHCLCEQKDKRVREQKEKPPRES